MTPLPSSAAGPLFLRPPDLPPPTAYIHVCMCIYACMHACMSSHRRRTHATHLTVVREQSERLLAYDTRVSNEEKTLRELSATKQKKAVLEERYRCVRVRLCGRLWGRL